MKHVDMTPADFGKALKIGKYAWPGGYPTFFLTSDGETMCHDCARKNGKQITDAIRTNSRDGWRVVAIDVNWEDPEMRCCNCGEQIESTYGRSDEREQSAASRAYRSGEIISPE